MAGCVLLMMYYTTVSGWMVDYFFRFLTGSFDGLTSEQAAGVFGEMLSNPVEMVFWMVVITLAGFVVCGRGLQGGLEKVGKWMMSALLVLILVLVVHSFTLSGAGEGLAFYLLPDWSRATGQGLGNVITAAMNQSFFTLSLGIGAIEIFGSYMDRGFTLPGEAARICVLDTFVAVCAGLIIFPACFSFGISPDAGPSLIFITLPNVFTNMAGGRLWGALFFLFMTFASFSTVIAVFENIIACARENFGWDRRRACLVGAAALVVLGLPCALGYNVWSNIQPLGAGSTVLDFEDFLVSNVLLPGGSLVYLLFCVTKWGWGFDKYTAECNTGSGPKMPQWVKPYFKYVLPVLIAVILVQGLL